MSGVKKLVQEDNGGLEQVTNENLKEEGMDCNSDSEE